MNFLSKKSVLITGGGSGIGASFAKKFVSLQCKVWVVGRNKNKLEEVNKLMNIVNLSGHSDIKAGSLSHGQKQWLEIAMLLGQKPSLMLIDEPVAGLTDEETDLTADLLKSLSGENTVLVIDHDMEFIRRLESNVTVLNQGSVLCEGSMDEIQTDPKVIEVYLGKQEDS